MNNYGIEDIESLSFKEGVRKRIAMYLGSADMQGIYNAIQEILSNSIDEYYMGFGKNITILLNNNLVTIIDSGRGVPFGIRENGVNVLEDIFSRSHTGGKFSDKVYQSVAGLNGIGAKATCLSSLQFECRTYRDGKMAQIIFEKGNMVNYQENISNDIKNGTIVSFNPDPEVFNLEEINIDFNILCDKCKNLSYLTKGLEFLLIDEVNKKKELYCAENGLLDLIKDKSESPINKIPIYYNLKDNENEVEIALQWTKGKEEYYTFTNGLYNSEGGTSLTGFKTSITRNINKEFGKNFTGEMARTGLIYAVSCKVPNPSFANQTKTKINNPELRSLVDKTFSEAFSSFKDQYPNEVKLIKDFLCKEEKAEIAAEKARQAVFNTQKEVQKELKKKTVLAGKLADCRFHDSDSKLFIVEGKSALGAICKARDSNTIACLPLRGKMINCLKNDIEDLLENEEIKDLNIALGCGFGENYNSTKLRYGKIVIVTDADMDGYSIMCLILTFFYRFYPKLIQEGKIFWGKTPLFKVGTGKKVMYAYTDEELSLLGKGNITRFKGLGELESLDFKNTIFSEQGRYIQFTMKDAKNAEYYFNMLLGKNIKDRRGYIFNNIDFSKVEE